MAVAAIVSIGPDPSTPWVIIDVATRTFTRTAYATDSTLQSQIVGVAAFDAQGSLLLIAQDRGQLKLHLPDGFPLMSLAIDRDLELIEFVDPDWRITVAQPLTRLLISAKYVFKFSHR